MNTTDKHAFVGSNVSEARVNGVEVPAASARLRELDWPRTEPVAFTRIFVMAIRPAGR